MGKGGGIVVELWWNCGLKLTEISEDTEDTDRIVFNGVGVL